ncbi:MAG: DUF4298 domain-containing protein [Lachnospiraceae bacterium]|nr:DUF4298 domain-containing protein [Lachnospiraceae bacterium]MBR7075649.1 DUF4298 domain-containing protein [Lachnospiraceae bacterium]
MDQLERIAKMSSYLKSAKEACDELDAAMKALADALEKYEQELEHIDQLAEYYDSSDWLHDFEDDEAGLIPEDIDRGALSEDGIYDLLMDQKNVEDILQQIQEYLQEN